MRLPNNFVIGDYTIVYYIKESMFCSSYRAMDSNAKSFFVKVFDISKMPESLLLNGTPKEITKCRTIRHENIIPYVTDGVISFEGNRYAYLVTKFLVGDLLSEVLLVNGLLTKDDRLLIIKEIANGLAYLKDSIGISHNDITPSNIVLVSDVNSLQLRPVIIDLGHATEPFTGTPAFPEEDIELEYRAPETFSGEYSYRSDIFSFSILIYELLFGGRPWKLNNDKTAGFLERETALLQQRQYPVEIPSSDTRVRDVLCRGLSEQPEDRPSYQDIIATFSEPLDLPMEKTALGQEAERTRIELSVNNVSTVDVKKGGFEDVAGLESLKKELRDRVIWVLKNKREADRYRITPPNGMLLYGPPGCGKTFFAQKFAEETGFNYRLINGSDIGSTLVHGSQIKIGELFQEAETNAPTVLCFDEFDAFVPVRGAAGAEYVAEEVNEFLSQLNNCSQRGIFVIGTTNRKDMIDPAVLRKGRLDLHFYIPEPDFETRKLMFIKHLNNRPLLDDINYDTLAEMTDNYASSDIAYIVNEAALAAALAGVLISQRHLEGAIKGNKSSLEITSSKRTKIGF